MKRVICGPDASGTNVVLYGGEPRQWGPPDDPYGPARYGLIIELAWASSASTGATSDVTMDLGGLDLSLEPGETRFMRIVIPPGAESPLHGTPGVTQYMAAVAGTLTFELEDGSSVAVEPGDLIVQLAGARHGWRNEGSVPFEMAAIVVGIEA